MNKQIIKQMTINMNGWKRYKCVTFFCVCVVGGGGHTFNESQKHLQKIDTFEDQFAFF